MRLFRPLLLIVAALLPTACLDQARGGGAGARGQIRAVGSSTLYPFTALVAEQLIAADPDAPVPVIESTGTGAGLRLFCAGAGADHPDLADASRRITAAEYARCVANRVGPVLEVPVGIDGVVVAQARGGPAFALTAADLYRALAAAPNGRRNAARTWADVNPALPAVPIRVLGPPASSGTRDAFAELVLLPGCRRVEHRPDPAECRHLREDGAWADAGENDNLVVRKLLAEPAALGVFGYGYLRENAGRLRGVALDGVRPNAAAIRDGRYPGARPLYLYVKANHLDAVPGLRRFLRLYASDWQEGGVLSARGLIASPPEVRAEAARIIAQERALDPATLA
jgi:phosphate transport system substrate-binding protein